tara:strand:+ start:209 stop:520 length:312 start_codon:yes stop_codon:yes gene_type:complete
MDNDTYILIKRRINMNRIQELESTIAISKKVLKNDKRELEELIYQEIKKDMELEFGECLDMPDIKELMHEYIIKELNHYKINNKTILKLESKLIEFCIEMGVK